MEHVMITLLINSAVMSVLMLLYMAVTPLLARRYSAKGRYYAWLILILALMIPLRPQFGRSLVTIMPVPAAMPVMITGNPEAPAQISPAVPAADSIIPGHDVPFSWWQAAAFIWITGTVMVLAFHLIRHYRFMAGIRRWREPVTDAGMQSLLEELKVEQGITGLITLCRCSLIQTPMLVGFKHPYLLLTADDLGAEELDDILRHELIHYRRRDLWYRGLVLAATAMHWFNPIVYLAAREIDLLCEMSCDAEVISRSDEGMRQRYCETIIRTAKFQAKAKTALSTNFYGGRNSMKKRLSSIIEPGPKRTGFVIGCAALFLTMGTGAMFAVNSFSAETGPEAAVTNVVPGDQDMAVGGWKPYPEYKQFGISYDENGHMLYQGQLVRYFLDGYDPEPDMSVVFYDYFLPEGTVDVYTIRKRVDHGDGSFDGFGELIEIAAYSQKEFESRDIEETIGAVSGVRPTEITGAEGSGGARGRTLEEVFLAYADYGIEYVPGTSGLGNVYYQGQIVKTFIDEKYDGGIFTLSSADSGDLIVRTVYDADDNLIGVRIDD